MSSQTAGGIFERQNSFRRTSLKLSEPNSAFETLNGKSSYVPPESPNMAWLPLRIFFVENSWYRYVAHIFLWRTINLRYSRQAERIFITNSLRKSSPGTRPSGSKMLLHQHLKKRERSMLLFKLDTSHASMGLLLPRSGSRVNKSQLPDESSKDSELLWDLHFQLALFFCKLALFFCKLALFFHFFFTMALFFFALAFSFSFQKKKLALF